MSSSKRGTAKGRILIDVSAPANIDQVKTYAWHLQARGPQVDVLYRAPDAPSFDAGSGPEAERYRSRAWGTASILPRQVCIDLKADAGGLDAACRDFFGRAAIRQYNEPLPVPSAHVAFSIRSRPVLGRPSRRSFLESVGRSALLATLGPVAFDMDLIPKAWGDNLDCTLTFGDLEPLVCELQDTPIDRLQRALIEKHDSGVSLKTLTGAAALANARTFGGEDYIGFHTFMALAPALKMSQLMSGRAEALPVLKVLYRNTQRIHDFGGRPSEVLHPVEASEPIRTANASALRQAVEAKDVAKSEQLLAALVAGDRGQALSALLPLVQDNPEVHRAVLPFRAWDMQKIVGTEHALTLLRQSLRYCLQSEVYRSDNWNEHSKMLTKLFDEFHLEQASPPSKQATDDEVRELSRHFAEATPEESARAAAMALSEGFATSTVGEALSLAASRLVLRDGGRLPQWETPVKPAGCVHGDSVGVHASDAANAWRNLATATHGTAAFSCIIIGAWQVARDRVASANLLDQPLPTERHLGEATATDATTLLAQLTEAVRFNQQAHATAIVHRYGEHSLPPDGVFSTLLQYAVSEDGALHAEKYFHTVLDDFHSTRPALRWQHVAALARVTASEYGRPADGQAEARALLRIDS